MRKMQKWLSVLGISACLFAMAEPGITAYAATEPTYELTNDTAEAEAYVGEVDVDDGLNVRTGFGADYDRVQVDGEYVILYDNDKVAVMSEGKASDGNTWYEVRWVEDGVEYHGYVRGKYVKKSDERALPLPTPTPVATPTPEATATPVPTPTTVATATPVPATPTPTVVPEEPKDHSGLKGVGIVAALLVIAVAVYLFVMKKKREAVVAETTEKIDNLKNIQLRKRPEDSNGNPISIMARKQELSEENAEETASRPAVKSYQSDADLLAKREQARMMNAEIMEKSRFYDPNEEKKKEDELKQLSESLKEKEILREEIDNLAPGDLVYHEYFGKGVVYDNTDVNRIEVRFGPNTYFIDRTKCVAQKLMRKI